MVVSQQDRRGRRNLSLLIAGRCNLRCAYCYQTHVRTRPRMEWGTARAALEGLLRWSPAELHVAFSGGEPLLEAGLLRDAVEYVEARRSEASSVEYVVTTNGTLMDPDTLEFLVAHDIAVDVSFDGLPGAQRRRAAGSFERLDGLLVRVRATQPDYFRRRLAVGVTLTAATIPMLSDSIGYFLDRGVGEIHVDPLLTWDPDWSEAAEAELRRQVGLVVATSLGHWQRSREVPVTFLRSGGKREDRVMSRFLCSACSGESLSVDADGRVWGCHLFASSLQDLPPLGREVAEVLDLGDIRDPRLEERIARLPQAGQSLPVLNDLEDKASSYGRCGECRFLADCVLCPLAICHVPGPPDPRRIPDFTCAFNRITFQAAADFRAQTAVGRLFDALERLEKPLRRLKEEIATSVG